MLLFFLEEKVDKRYKEANEKFKYENIQNHLQFLYGERSDG